MLDHHHRLRLALAAAPLLLAATSPAALAAGTTTERVSVSSHGAQATGGSGGDDPPSVSADGRFVAFESDATDLVPGDTNARHCQPGHFCGRDIFVHDRKAGSTERVSVSSSGAQATGGFADSLEPAISADGRFVAFQSDAANLVPGDTNGTEDVFVRDRKLGTTERVSVSSGGVQGDDFSGDGVAISADGRFVAFESIASNLVAGGGKRNEQIFVRDRKLGKTELVSLSSDGRPGNRRSDYGLAISADGRFVAFASQASNLVPGDTNTNQCGEGSCGFDIFVRDRGAGTTERVSVGPAGQEGNGPSTRPSISADGRYVAFESLASTLLPSDRNFAGDVFVRDRKKGTLEVVSLTSAGAEVFAHSASASISADGRYVAFELLAGKLVPGDTNGATDVFVRDREAGTTARASLSSAGGQTDGPSIGPAISADGRVVAFSSTATDLVPGDTNGKPDVFVRTR